MLIPIRDDNPTHIMPILTITIIVICVLTFLWQLSLPAEGYYRVLYGLGVIPMVLTGHAQLHYSLALVPPELTVVTALFLHGGWLHLFLNMLYLWICGDNVEDSMGHMRFLLFYLICGAIATLAQAFVNPTSEAPMIGASGAIAGVLGAYLLLFPHARMVVVIPFNLVRVPAVVVLSFWFFMQLVNSIFLTAEEGGVAWFAHLGGFIAGMALIPLFKHPDAPLFRPGHGSTKWHRRIHRKHDE